MATKFGHEMRKHFLLDDNYTNLNHGSFGVIPRAVRDAQRSFQDRAEARPDFFIRYDGVAELNSARRAVARLINAPTPAVVMIPNATSGVNTILRNLRYDSTDVIIYFSVTYGACQKIIAATSEYTGCRAHCVNLDYPMSDEAVLDAFAAAVSSIREQGLTPRALLLDTIVSLPGVLMPYEALVESCRVRDVLSIVDGAHGYGQLQLDMAALDPDFFVTNCHKWGFLPRPCAVLYVPERNQHLIRTTFPTSHFFVPLSNDAEPTNNPLPAPGADDTRFTKMFEFVGSTDYSAYCCIQAALDFRRDVCGGEAAIHEYCRSLAAEGSRKMAQMLGTEVMAGAPIAMTNVRMPISLEGGAKRAETDHVVALGGAAPASLARWAQTESLKYDTFIAFIWHNGSLWARLSAQVYLDLSDFERGGDILKDLAANMARGEHL